MELCKKNGDRKFKKRKTTKSHFNSRVLSQKEPNKNELTLAVHLKVEGCHVSQNLIYWRLEPILKIHNFYFNFLTSTHFLSN